MKRLLWKEFRERRWWALVWALSILGVSLFGDGQTFVGDTSPMSMLWLFPSLLIGLLAGLGAYTTESVRGRAEFAFSRPIPWQAVLAAKLIFLLVLALGVPLLAVAIKCVVSPDYYRPFMALPHLLVGAWAVGWKLGVVYLFGMACSLVVPGYAGGLLTLASMAIAMVAMLAGITGTIIHVDSQLKQVAAIVIGTLVAAFIAAIPLVRFGLTLDTSERVKRFAPIFAIVMPAIWALSLLVPNSWWVGKVLLVNRTNMVSVSPTAKYAVVTRYWATELFGLRAAISYDDRYREAGEIVNLADGRTIGKLPLAPLQSTLPTNWHWATDSAAIGYVEYTNHLYVVLPALGKVIIPSTIEVGRTVISPDQRYLIVPQQKNSAGTFTFALAFFDLNTGQLLRQQVPLDGPIQVITIHWLNNRTFTYLDNVMQQYTASVPAE